MSRHTVPHPADVEIVVGFDAPLCAFFGQRFSADGERVEAGYPTPEGLGVQPRLDDLEQAVPDVLALGNWMVAQGVRPHDAIVIAGRLIREWRDERRELSGPYALIAGAFAPERPARE